MYKVGDLVWSMQMRRWGQVYKDMGGVLLVLSYDPQETRSKHTAHDLTSIEEFTRMCALKYPAAQKKEGQ